MARTIGRPREGESPTGLGAAQDILFASARLFTGTGYGSTTTHAIAQLAGLSQPSIYHHFGSKKEILLALLTDTVQPSIDIADTLLAGDEPPAARLWALCAADTALLSGGDVNIGELYYFPELSDEYFASFHEMLGRLMGAYLRLVEECGYGDAELGANLVIGLTGSITRIRRRKPQTIDETTAGAFADACLRILGYDEAEVAEARALGESLAASFEVRTPPWNSVISN